MEERCGPNAQVESSNLSGVSKFSLWLCRWGFHDWNYSVLRVIYPECGGAVPCYFERTCGVCEKEEKGSDWF